MKLLLLICIVVLILISVFLLSKVTIHIEYHHTQEKNKAIIKVQLWRGLIHYSKVVQLSDEKYQPSSYRESTYRQQNQSNQSESSADESLSMDGVQAAFQNLKEMLSQLRSYQETVKKFTSKIQMTDLQMEIHYGTGEASTTAVATGALWGLTGGAIGIISQYFSLMIPPKIDIIPYFSVKKPFETKIECIARVRMAKTIVAGWKLARLMLRE
ncbi:MULTISPECIES: DUF2953 domain-containing protein [unclassified Bacillus (in: firmicutes)]|uniref:DUF2953 domain-containing protein n=1 Tax=unclassified Bacillus (in: firmicutes) TaxID=185979 RepID=UPI00080AF484|nr:MULTISPECIES: DUF2953 domain-containing protein [unclassified Bacillus (in: firmicutes)]OCA81845.1 hypothetical protein A8L44_14680 [Bacillus sp. FJAT-27986]